MNKIMAKGDIFVFLNALGEKRLAILKGYLRHPYGGMFITKLEVNEANIELLSQQKNDIWEQHELSTRLYTILEVVGHNPNFE